MLAAIRLEADSIVAHDRHLELRHGLRFPAGSLPDASWTTRVEPAAAAVADRSVVPAIPAAYVLACRLGFDLQVVEPLPPALHVAARQVGELLAGWYGWRPAELIAPLGTTPLRSQRLRRQRRRGLFFTRGVDSWGTYLELAHGPAGDRPTHLITVDNEVHLPVERREAAIRDTSEVARTLGLPIIVVRTDVRAVLDPHTDWGTDTHGSVLAGIGLALRASLDRVTISPTHWTPLLRPWGSHPDLDPAWSLPELQVIHHPGDVPRWARVAQIVEHPLAASSLQVCWQGISDRNCGRCEKCLRLLTSLELLGRREAMAERFDVDLDLDAIDRLASVSPHPWCDTIDHCDVVGLRADPLRQRWEGVERVGRPAMAFRTRPVQPRLRPVAPMGPGDERSRRDLGRSLARAGLRLDHRATPLPNGPDLTIAIEERAGRLVLIADDAAIEIPDLRPGALDGWLARRGIDPATAEPFDPDGQPAPEADPHPSAAGHAQR
jgi:hypothetical protein